MDILTLVTVEQSTVSTIATRVLDGDVRAANPLCDVMRAHIRGSETVLLPLVSSGHDELAAEHAKFERLIQEFESRAQARPPRELAEMALTHTQREAEILVADLSGMPREARDAIGQELSRRRHEASASPAQDPGASSDGDGSWTAAPLTQDPTVDRSVPTVIARTQGA